MKEPQKHLHRNASSTQYIYGSLLETGDILEPGDMYESTNGRWEECPCPGITLISSKDGALWVRPTSEPVATYEISLPTSGVCMLHSVTIPKKKPPHVVRLDNGNFRHSETGKEYRMPLPGENPGEPTEDGTTILDPLTFEIIRLVPVRAAEEMYDGLTADECLNRYKAFQRDEVNGLPPLTDTQKEAARRMQNR